LFETRAILPFETERFSLQREWPAEVVHMADDWVDKYLKSWNDKARQTEISLHRARFVEQGASPFFDNLYKRIHKDFASFQSIANDMHLTILRQGNRFSVIRDIYPMLKLEVWLSGSTIEYLRSCLIDRSQNDFQEEESGQISLVSDLSGNLQARLKGRLLKDSSEMSESLLTPVFNYLKEHCV
jgi:hypothetical protein